MTLQSRIRLGLFLLLFISYAYFYQGGGWNQNSRFALVRAVLNDRSFVIDPYERNTGDKAIFKGHYYSDKAPGTAFLALPVVAVARAACLLAGVDPETFAGLAFLSYIGTIFTVSLSSAVAGVILYEIAAALAGSRTGGVLAAIAAGLGTPLWGQSTLFVGHALSAAFLVFAFGAAWRASQLAPPVDNSHAPNGLRHCGWIIGLSGGWATITEFPAAIPATVMAAWYAVVVWRDHKPLALRALVEMSACALTSAALLGAYQYACFGAPWHLAYSSEAGFEGMREGLFGIGMPRLHVLADILVGSYRGLLPLSPIAAVAAVGFGLARRHRAAWALSGLFVLYYLLLNASYHYWEGGWSLGPRHLSPALPFLALGVATAWQRSRTALRAGILACLLASVVLSLIGVSTTAQPPANVGRPMQELLWPAFQAGELGLNTATFVHASADPTNWRHEQEPRAAFNLGQKLGLGGLWSLLPLIVAWLVLGRLIVVQLLRPQRPTSEHTVPIQLGK